MSYGWIPSVAFFVLFSALFIRDYRFWREMKRWPTYQRMKKSPPILDRPEMYQEDAISHRLLEIAEHNMTTSLVGWIASACIMALDVYLSVVG